MKKYYKKPAIITAIQVCGHNIPKINNILHTQYQNADSPITLVVPTLHGKVMAADGDYIIVQENGNIVLEREFFEANYEEVKEGDEICRCLPETRRRNWRDDCWTCETCGKFGGCSLWVGGAD